MSLLEPHKMTAIYYTTQIVCIVNFFVQHPDRRLCSWQQCWCVWGKLRTKLVSWKYNCLWSTCTLRPRGDYFKNKCNNDFWVLQSTLCIPWKGIQCWTLFSCCCCCPCRASGEPVLSEFQSSCLRACCWVCTQKGLCWQTHCPPLNLSASEAASQSFLLATAYISLSLPVLVGRVCAVAGDAEYHLCQGCVWGAARTPSLTVTAVTQLLACSGICPSSDWFRLWKHAWKSGYFNCGISCHKKSVNIEFSYKRRENITCLCVLVIFSPLFWCSYVLTFLERPL